MKVQCQLCLEDYTSKLSQPNTPVVPPCGHAICSNCLMTEMRGKPCYLRCEVVRVKDTHPIRLKYIDSGVQNWKQLVDSKSYKCLQELNLTLDERAKELDDERAILAKALQDYSEGMVIEQALHGLYTELAALETQDLALRQLMMQETEKLYQLKKKVACISSGGRPRGANVR